MDTDNARLYSTKYKDRRITIIIPDHGDYLATVDDGLNINSFKQSFEAGCGASCDIFALLVGTLAGLPGNYRDEDNEGVLTGTDTEFLQSISGELFLGC